MAFEKLDFMEVRQQILTAMRRLQDVHARENVGVEEGSAEQEQLIFVQYAVAKLRDCLDDIDEVLDDL